MIDFGVEYSYFTVGKSFIFLRVKFNDPTTVYYHIIAPDQAPEGEDKL